MSISGRTALGISSPRSNLDEVMECPALESKVYPDETGINDRDLPFTADENGSVTNDDVDIPGGLHLSSSSEVGKHGSGNG